MFGSLEQQVYSNDQTVLFKISKIVCIVFKVCMNLKKTTHKNKEIGVCVENDDDQ